jgi:hypothetical protein
VDIGLHTPAEAVGRFKDEGLSGARTDVFADNPPFELAQFGELARIVVRNPNMAHRIAAMLYCAMRLCAESIRSQRRGVDPIQPDWTGILHLVSKGERLLVHQQPMPGRRVAVPAFELFDQVRHDDPAICAGRGCEAIELRR